MTKILAFPEPEFRAVKIAKTTEGKWLAVIADAVGAVHILCDAQADRCKAEADAKSLAADFNLPLIDKSVLQ